MIKKKADRLPPAAHPSVHYKSIPFSAASIQAHPPLVTGKLFDVIAQHDETAIWHAGIGLASPHPHVTL